MQFTGQYVRVSDMQYPFTKYSIAKSIARVSLPANPSDEVLSSLGFEPVYEGDVPEHDTLKQIAHLDGVEFIDGVYKTKWVVTPRSMGDTRSLIDAERDKRLEAGMLWVFPNGASEHVQIRDRDMIFLSARSMRAHQLKADGVTDPVIVFRTMEDNNHMLTPDEMIALTDAADSHIQSIWNWSWVEKDSLEE